MLQVIASKRRSVVDIELPRYPPHKKRLSEGIQKTSEPFMQIKLRMGNKSAHVVYKGDKIGLPLFAFPKDARAMHDIRLP
jgi:hypothetical protein